MYGNRGPVTEVVEGPDGHIQVTLGKSHYYGD
jgi:hypothetical protein